MRYSVRPNSDLEGWDIIDNQLPYQPTDLRDPPEGSWVMTIFEDAYVLKTLDWLNSGESDANNPA